MNILSFDIFKLLSQTVAAPGKKYHNRDISWLAFNHRVLQEAKDHRNPLFERLKFLAIYSSNSDEFFRVRVASLRNLMKISQRTKKKYDIVPDQLLEEINKIVKRQQREYDDIFHNQLLKEMRNLKVFLVSEKELKLSHEKFLERYFQANIQSLLQPQIVGTKQPNVFLHSRQIYFFITITAKAAGKIEHALLELPTQKLARFVELPKFENKYYVIFLDDIIRKFLPVLFPNHTVTGVYSIKLTRDAELYFEDEYTGDLVELIRKAVSGRKTGSPSRLLFDHTIPHDGQLFLRKILQISENELIPAGRYLNFSDFFNFPNPDNRLPAFTPLKPVLRNDITSYPSLFDAISGKDWLFHYPYESYDHFLFFLNQSANDPNVSQIRITLYRVASDSSVVKELIAAAKNGKKVMAYIELFARFDEESNIQWAEQLKSAGVRVQYGIPRIKVHAKMCLVTRTEGSVKRRYGYLGTGNFNEVTARVYTDFGFFTSDIRITNELFTAFRFLNKKSAVLRTNHLLIAPFTLRSSMIHHIDNEISLARSGTRGEIILKVNGLEDREMIDKLYQASQAGVSVRIIVRGICCLLPGDKSFSKNIQAISIVGRFLEHSRIYYFRNGGNEVVYLSSADWMTRNLDRRIEVAFPIYDSSLKSEITQILTMQLNDTVKSRIIDKNLKNAYRTPAPNTKAVDSQIEIYSLIQKKRSTAKS